MSVKTISKDELRRMEGSEGLILQGCGGSLDEWVDGINDMLTEDGILLDGTRVVTIPPMNSPTRNQRNSIMTAPFLPHHRGAMRCP